MSRAAVPTKNTTHAMGMSFPQADRERQAFCESLDRGCRSDQGDVRALIPKYNCATFPTLLNFKHGHSRKDRTSSNCRR